MRIRNFLAGAVALLFLISPSITFAATSVDFEAQISALKEQLAALKGGASSVVTIGTTKASDVRLRVTTPNGGEEYAAGSNKSMTIRWSAIRVPQGATVCASLVNEDTGEKFLWGSCKAAKNGMGGVAGKFVQNAGYDLGPGTYRAEVAISAKPNGEKDGAVLVSDLSDKTFMLTGATGPTSAFLSYALVNKAVDPGESWVEGANLEGFLLQIKNTLPTAQSITFPTNCWWTYRIYDVATGKVAFDLKDVQECLKPGSATPTTFTLQSGETKSLDFSHNDSTFHLVPGSYRMNIDVNSTRPAANAASFVFGVAAKTTSSAKPACTITATSPRHIGTSPSTIAFGDSITITWASANATYAILPGGDKGPTSGTETYRPDVSKTYTYKFVGPGGETTCSQAVTVVGGETPGTNATSTATSTATDTLSATPWYGAAPLKVVFSGVANKKKSCGGGAHTLSFGDGTSYQIAFPADLCKEKTWSVVHTYLSSGTYTAGLYGGLLIGKNLITRVGITVAPAFVESSPTTRGTTGTTVTKPSETPDTTNPNTSGTNTGGNPQTDTKTLPDTLGCSNGTRMKKGGECPIEASAYLSLLSAIAAIQAQLNELVR